MAGRSETTAYHGSNATYSKDYLSKVKIGGSYYYLKDEDARAILDGIYSDYLKSDDKIYLVELVSAEETRAKAAEGTLDGKITTANGLIAGLRADLTTETSERTSADQGLQTQIDAIKADAAKVAEGEKIISKNANKELQTTLNISIETVSNKDHIVLRGVGGVEVAKVDASKFVKDGMIESVELVEHDGKKWLKITWNTDAGKQPVEIELTTLIDVYTAGKGLELTGNQFSVKIDEDSEDFLSVSVNGVKLDGVQAAINLAKSDAISTAEGYADTLNAAMDERVSVFEANGAHDVAALEGRVTTAEGNISTLQTKVTTIEGKPAYGITSTQIENWDNEVGAKAALAIETSERKAADTAINNKIGSSTDTSSANTVYGAIKKEAEDRAAGDAAAEQAANNYTDGKIAAEVTARDAAIKVVSDALASEVTRATGAESGLNGRLTTAETKLAGIEDGAQVNVVEKIKINNVEKTVTAGTKVIDLGFIATDERVTTLEGRVTTAEGKLDVIQGTGAGSISKAAADAKSEAIGAAKDYTDGEITKVEAEISTLSGDFADHTHSVTASGKITPNLTKSEKHLGVSTGVSDEFVKEVTNEAKGLAVAKYINSVGKVNQQFNNLTATVGDGTDNECLVFSTTAFNFDSVGAIGEANAATGALSTDSGLAQVVTSINATSKGTAIGSVSLTNNGSTGIAFVESVAGVEQTVNVTGTAAKVSK